MFRAKVLIFMIPLILPIGQPPAQATDGVQPTVMPCAVTAPADLPDVGQTIEVELD